MTLESPFLRQPDVVSKSPPSLDLPPAVPVDPLKLDLDWLNPRLANRGLGRKRSKLLEALLEQFKVLELADSIARQGFVPFDPIIAYTRNGKRVVREGNRRVAAIQLLLKPSDAPERYRDRFARLASSMKAPAAQSIKKIPVHVYTTATDPQVELYIGFRHVTGVLDWPSLEKASFIADLVDNKRMSYASAAEVLGLEPGPVERHYVAYRFVLQCKAKKVAGAAQMEKNFGVLLRTLQSGQVRDFLGLTYPKDPAKSRNPSPSRKLADVRRFVKWTFGTDAKGKGKIMPESRKATEWGHILVSKTSIAYLRQADEPEFSVAYDLSSGPAKHLSKLVRTAAASLEQAASIAGGTKEDVSEDDLRRCVMALKTLARGRTTVAKLLK